MFSPKPLSLARLVGVLLPLVLTSFLQAQNYGQLAITEDLSPLGVISTANTRIIDVTASTNAYVVPNDGSADAACPLHNLLSSYHPVDYGFGAVWQDKIFYLPNGTYKLSDKSCLPIVKNYGTAAGSNPAYGMVLIGQSQSGVQLNLDPSLLPKVTFTGTTTAASNTITVSSTTGLYAGQFIHGAGIQAFTSIVSVGASSISVSPKATASGTGTSFYTTVPVIMPQSDLQSGQQFGNAAFHNVIENLTINIGWNTGNSGASGIAFYGSNMAAIRNVTLNGNGQPGTISTGIDMTMPVIGPAIIENVAINGFGKGIDVANDLASIVVEHVTLNDQLMGAIFNADNLVVANLLDIKSNNNSIPAITNTTANGFVIVNNSKFEQTGTSLISNATSAPIALYNATFAATQTGFPTGVINGTMSGGTFTAGSALSNAYLGDTPVPVYDGSGQWVGFPVSSTGEWTDALGGVVDDAAALRAAFACPNNMPSTMYLPHGVYYVGSTIQVPPYITRIIGMDATIRPTSTFPTNNPIFEVLSAPAGTCANPPAAVPLVIERLGFDNPSARSGVAAVQVDAPTGGAAARTVVMRDLFTSGILRLNQKLNGGKVYLEDTAGSGMTIAGPNAVYARQYNSEAGSDSGPRVTNNGAPFWALGFKTEGPNNVIASTTTTTSANEVIGGFFITAPGNGQVVATSESCSAAAVTVGSGNTSTPATFIMATGSSVQASFIEEVIPHTGEAVGDKSFPWYLSNPCQKGSYAASGSGYTAYPSLHRVPTAHEPTEGGYIVTQINDTP